MIGGVCRRVSCQYCPSARPFSIRTPSQICLRISTTHIHVLHRPHRPLRHHNPINATRPPITQASSFSSIFSLVNLRGPDRVLGNCSGVPEVDLTHKIVHTFSIGNFTKHRRSRTLLALNPTPTFGIPCAKASGRRFPEGHGLVTYWRYCGSQSVPGGRKLQIFVYRQEVGVALANRLSEPVGGLG